MDLLIRSTWKTDWMDFLCERTQFITTKPQVQSFWCIERPFFSAYRRSSSNVKLHLIGDLFYFFSTTYAVQLSDVLLPLFLGYFVTVICTHWNKWLKLRIHPVVWYLSSLHLFGTCPLTSLTGAPFSNMMAVTFVYMMSGLKPKKNDKKVFNK